MGIKYYVIIIMSTLLLACNKNSFEYLSNWKSSPPIIDGSLEEWQLPLEQPSSQIPIKYRCSNDGQYLYLAIQAGDEYLKALMLHQGLKIWIDTTGKRKEKFGLGYPIPLKNTETEALGQEAKGNEKKFMELYAEAMQEFDLYGLADDESLRFSNLTSKDIKVYMGFDQLNTLSMELRIPLKMIYGCIPSLNETFSLGIVINNLPRSMDDEHNDGSIFNDRNQTGITQSNPILGPTPQQPMNQAPRQASMPSIWAKIILSDNKSD